MCITLLLPFCRRFEAEELSNPSQADLRFNATHESLV